MRYPLVGHHWSSCISLPSFASVEPLPPFIKVQFISAIGTMTDVHSTQRVQHACSLMMQGLAVRFQEAMHLHSCHCHLFHVYLYASLIFGVCFEEGAGLSPVSCFGSLPPERPWNWVRPLLERIHWCGRCIHDHYALEEKQSL